MSGIDDGAYPFASSMVVLPQGQVDLRSAVESVSRQANVRLIFADDLLDGIWLSCESQRVTLTKALELLLAGTSIETSWSGDGGLILKSPNPSWLCLGQVIDQLSQRPIPKARIRLFPGLRSVSSNELGQFELPQLDQSQHHEIQVQATGFNVATQQIGPNQDPLVVELAVSAQLVQSMQVYSSHDDQREVDLGHAYVIRPNRMVVASGGDDLFDILRTLPGVSPNRLGESGVSFRGSEPAENLVLLDDIKLYQMDHALGYYSAISSDAVDEIRIYKGGYPANYGERTSGVLDIRTLSDRPERAEGSLGIDRDMAKLTFAFPIMEAGDFWFSMRKTIDSRTTDVVYGRVFEQTFNEQPNDFSETEGIFADQAFDFRDFIGKLSLYHPNGLRFTATVFEGRDDSSEEIGFDLVPEPFTVYEKTGSWGNRGVSVSLSGELNSDVSYRLTSVWSEYFSNFDFTEVRFSERDESFDVRRAETENRMVDRHTGIVFAWRVNDHVNIDMGMNFGDINTEFFERQAQRNIDRLADTKQRSLYAQSRWRPIEKLNVVLGLRTIHNELTDSSQTEPRLFFDLRIHDPWSVRAGYGEYSQHVLRSPDTLNYFSGLKTWFLAQENIQPGLSEHRFVGLRLEKAGFLVDVEAFERESSGHLSKLFDPSQPDSGAFQYASQASGLDMHLERSFGAHRMQFAYAYLRSRATKNISRGFELDYPTDTERPHTYKLFSEFHWGAWLGILSWNYASGLPYGIPSVDISVDDQGHRFFALGPSLQPNSERLRTTHQLDVNGRYRFAFDNIQGELGVSITNIYEQDNVIYRYYVLERDEVVPVDVRGLDSTVQMTIRLNF